ncbi:MAG: ATP-binding protein [Erythrobacter sp.]|uniref:ATP-binding protein n=1 Tax=Erythrobacter sp. TaxID=1042 RepID=UPI0032633B53
MKEQRSRFSLGTAENQILVILVSAFVVLLVASTVYQVSQNRTAEEWAQSEYTGKTVAFRLLSLDRMRPEEMQGFVDANSSCDEGFTVTEEPYAAPSNTQDANDIRRSIAANLEKMSGLISLNKSMADILVARATFTERDFAFAKCEADEIEFPIDGIVISIQLETGEWFNLSVTERRFEFGGESIFSAIRIDFFFLLVGIIALFFVLRLTRPLSRLTQAVSRFGTNLEVEDVEESGPVDIRKAIRRFNTMQREVRDEMKRRTQMLASVGHDIRTPLTALRVKAELIENEEAREDIIAGIEKMERITASALDFVRGESRSEPKQHVDLRALIESECSEFEELGYQVSFTGESDVHYDCRPIALARAIRNLIDNSVKYAGSADVELVKGDEWIEIWVLDSGPGIPDDQKNRVLDPFTRLSDARESEKGGLGLGLAITKAIVDGHDGVLKLEPNQQKGLKAAIQLPFNQYRAG